MCNGKLIVNLFLTLTVYGKYKCTHRTANTRCIPEKERQFTDENNKKKKEKYSIRGNQMYIFTIF